MAQGGDTYLFGPPLRNNILFSYIYTERVKNWLVDPDGQEIDSSERTLVYYITQRQIASRTRQGAFELESNIDSMRLVYRGTDGEIEFNTQVREHIEQMELVRHPAVLVPSALVNAVNFFTISPYGSVVDTIRSPSISSLKRQRESPHLDDFTYKRMDHILEENYLTTIFFPWRGVVPIGALVSFGEPFPVPFVAALDRITFADTATALLSAPGENEKGPTLSFTAPLSNRIDEWMTYDLVPSPVLLNDADGTISGRLELDQDGVVLRGFTTANGMAKGSARGKKVNVRVEHQTFIEQAGMINFAVDADR